MHRLLVRSMLAALALALGACGGGGDSTAPSPVASLDVAPATASLVVGDSQPMTAHARDQAGQDVGGQTVTWTSSAPTIARVVARTAQGAVYAAVVQALSAGTAVIRVSANGRTDSATVTVAAPAPLVFASVAAGGAHTCALTTDGVAWCWGRDESGQLGAPATTTCAIDGGTYACALVPVKVQTSLTFALLAAGGAHTCGLTSAGVAWCWGANNRGQLGDNSTTDRPTPTAVATSLTFTSIDGGADHTCGLTSAGAAWCWGYNSRGQLGDSSLTQRTAPTAVAGGLTFTAISTGGFNVGQTCALAVGGAAWCWGANDRGQLGIGAADNNAHPGPAAVAGGHAFAAITVGLDRHACALTSAGEAWCWGENSFGALGDSTQHDRSAPVTVAGGHLFSQIVAGGFIGHTCALTATGVAWCWGDNERGAIGDGTTDDAFVPRAVIGGHTYTRIDAGYRHTCALATNDLLYCWGSNGAGQLGSNSVVQRESPVRVARQ